MRYFLNIVTVAMRYFLNIVIVTMRYSLKKVTVTMPNPFLISMQDQYLSKFFESTFWCELRACTHGFRARADVVATKLGIILFLLSFSFLPRTFLPEGVCLGS